MGPTCRRNKEKEKDTTLSQQIMFSFFTYETMNGPGLIRIVRLCVRILCERILANMRNRVFFYKGKRRILIICFERKIISYIINYELLFDDIR